MQVSYDLKVDEINLDFINSIKNLFVDKEIRITIEDVDKEDEALSMAIKDGLESETISKDEFLKALSADWTKKKFFKRCKKSR